MHDVFRVRGAGLRIGYLGKGGGGRRTPNRTPSNPLTPSPARCQAQVTLAAAVLCESEFRLRLNRRNQIRKRIDGVCFRRARDSACRRASLAGFNQELAGRRCMTSAKLKILFGVVVKHLLGVRGVVGLGGWLGDVCVRMFMSVCVYVNVYLRCMHTGSDGA